MESSALVGAVGKLAIAGEQAGFTVEQMIDLLNSGLTVATLLELIEWRLEALRNPRLAPVGRSSGWVVGPCQA